MSTSHSPVRSLRRVTNRLRRDSSASDSQAAALSAPIARKMSVSDIDPTDLLDLSVCNLPEMLARDLDICEGAFVTKNMTAGAPVVRNLAFQDDFLLTGQVIGGSEDSAEEAKDSFARRTSFGGIEDQLALPDPDDVGEWEQTDFTNSDLSSDSGIAEPPSVRMRKESVVTAATSVNTHRYSNSNSRCCSPSLGLQQPQQQNRCSLTAFMGGNLDHIDHLNTSWFDQGVTPEDSAEDSSDDSMFGDDLDAVPTMPHPMAVPTESAPVVPQPEPVPDADQEQAKETPIVSVSFTDELQAGRSEADASPQPGSSQEPISPSQEAAQPFENGHEKGLSYIKKLRQRRAAERQRLKDTGPISLEINPLTLNPAMFTRGTPFRALPPSGALNNAAQQQRPISSSAVSPTEKSQPVDIPWISRSDRQTSLRTGILLTRRQSLRYEPEDPRPSTCSSEYSVAPAAGLSPRPKSRIVKGFKIRLSRMSEPIVNDQASVQTPAKENVDGREESKDDSIDEIINEYKDKWDARAAMSPIIPGGTGHEAGFGASTIRPGIPLSPEVIENLRVSISGFPDTMLLTSCLSIETIRSYAKKLRHHTRSESTFSHHQHTTSLSRVSSHPPPNSSNTTTPFLWKRSLGGRNARHSGSTNYSIPLSTSSPATLSRVLSSGSITSPNWSCIKSIFPAGSDYRCEALYAHLVAYNYITTVCGSRPRTGSMPTRLDRRPSLPPRTETDELYPVVPKKAAHLLGLSSRSGGSARPLSSPVGRMKELFRQKGKDGTEETEEELKEALGGKLSARTGSNETALREVRDGLVRCVAVLVDLLGRSEEMGWEEEEEHVPGVEPYLFRALCELVRAEEDLVE